MVLPPQAADDTLGGRLTPAPPTPTEVSPTEPAPGAGPPVRRAPFRELDAEEGREPQPASAGPTAGVETPPRAQASSPQQHETARDRPARVQPRDTKSPPAAFPEATEPAPADELWEAPAFGVETELGGIFYLLNLFLYLGLYGDFTQPLTRGIALDPWECVGLVARRLLGRETRNDPLWRLLERLAAPSAFRPPFPVVAVPRTDEPARDQLARELHRLRLAPTLRRSSLRREPQRPLARWVARLAAYAEARLRVATELPLDTVLRRRARVFVTSSHVDVVLSLAELPLEVRFAGLDRTPGWIPATGRFVAFHFE